MAPRQRFAAALHWAGSTPVVARARWVPWALACAALVVFHALTLLRFPPPFADEAWYAARAQGFLETGRAFGVLDAGVLDRYPGAHRIFPLLPVWIHAAFIAVVGEPSLLAMRASSLASAVALAVAVAAIARRTISVRAGYVAAIALGLSPTLLLSGHLARTDVMAAAFAWGGIAIYLTRGPRPRALALIGGVVAGLSVEAHPHGAVVLLAFGLARVLELRGRFWTAPDLLLFVLGAALSGGGMLAARVLPDPELYAFVSSKVFATSHTPPLLRGDLGALLRALAGMPELAAQLGMGHALAAAAALGLALVPRSPARKLAPLALLSALVYLALLSNRFAYYAIVIAPALALLVAAGLETVLALRARSAVWLGTAAFALALASPLPDALTLSSPDRAAAFEQVLARLRPHVAPGQSLIGAQTYWFGLRDRRYFSWEQLVYHQRFTPKSTWQDALRTLRPDILILDEHLRVFLVDERGSQPYGGTLSLPARQLHDYLVSNATVLDAFESPHLGRFIVFRLRWDQAVP